MIRVRLIIHKKKGVFDPEAKVIESALGNLEHRVSDAHVGKIIEFDVESSSEEAAQKEVAIMCKEFLVNPVLETYRFEVVK